LIASLTRRRRGLGLELLRAEVADDGVQELLELAVLLGRARNGQARPLPEVVVVDLGDRGAEALVQLRLGGLHVLSLSLERIRLRKVELDREDADVAARHPGIQLDGLELLSPHTCCKASLTDRLP
jgi:hypothetical protein